jgi:hypothetical protein
LKVYVASSWRNEVAQQGVVANLRAAGHEVYDFRNPHATGVNSNGAKGRGFGWKEVDPDWQNWTPEQFKSALSSQLAIDGFNSDLDALKWCDACVMVPGKTAGRSMHLELGFVAGMGKPTAILLSDGEPELMYRMATLCLSIGEVVEFLDREEKEISK